MTLNCARVAACVCDLPKGSLGPIWDHLKLLYIECLTASSFPFFSFYVISITIQAVVQEVTVVGASMGASTIWSYIELFGEDRIARAVFVDQAPLQVQI